MAEFLRTPPVTTATPPDTSNEEGQEDKQQDNDYVDPAPLQVNDDDKSKEPADGSGLQNALKDFLPDESDEDKSAEPDKKPDDKTGAADDKSKLPDGDMTKMTQEQLIEEVKKNQRIAQERFNEIETLKKQGTGEGDSDATAFINEIKKDPVKAWRNYAEKLGLPDATLVSQMFTNTEDYSDRFEQWQSNELIPSIEKKFKLEDGEFEFNPKEQFRKGTASYEFRVRTQEKEAEYRQELVQLQTNKEAQLQKAKQAQEADLQWIAEKYFNKDINTANDIAVQLNEIPEKISKGEMTAEQHPFSMRNLVRGAFYESFVKMEVDKAVNDVVGQFNQLGMFLPQNEKPTDVTSVKTPPITDVAKDKFISPMLASMNMML